MNRPSWTRNLLYAVLLWTWIQYIFLNPLGEEAEEMHRQQLDPTEIVLIPVPLERLVLAIALVVFGVVLTAATHPFSKLFAVAFWSVVNAAVMILCGASHSENLGHTWLASVYATALILWDLLGEEALPHQTLANKQSTTQHKQPSPTSNNNNYSDDDFLWRISPPSSDKSPGHHHLLHAPAVLRAHTTVMVCIIFQIFRLYDRGWQIQRWPIPTIVGATVGWILGLVVHPLVETCFLARKRGTPREKPVD